MITFFSGVIFGYVDIRCFIFIMLSFCHLSMWFDYNPSLSCIFNMFSCIFCLRRILYFCRGWEQSRTIFLSSLLGRPLVTIKNPNIWSPHEATSAILRSAFSWSILPVAGRLFFLVLSVLLYSQQSFPQNIILFLLRWAFPGYSWCP